MRKLLAGAIVWACCAAAHAPAATISSRETLTLENSRLRLTFDRTTGTLAAIRNKLAEETYGVEGDGFAVDADEFHIESNACRLIRFDRGDRTVHAVHAGGGLTAEVAYTLGAHFVEKHIALRADRAFSLRKITLSQPRFVSKSLSLIVPYRYQQNATYFGRTPKGGFFTGVEVPFDTSLLEGDRVTLAYRPGIKVKAGQWVQCEPAYWGVYRRHAHEDALAVGKIVEGNYQHLPLASESDAMVAMVSQILGPPRLGPTSVLAPVCCGGIPLGKTDERWFEDRKELEKLKRIADFAAECGIEYFDDYLPWSGEFKAVDALTDDKQLEICAWNRELLAYAAQRGLKPIIWSTMNNVLPWRERPRPAFRADKPDWRVKYLAAWPHQEEANCMGVNQYQHWLTAFVVDRMARGGYRGFSLDGDFAGGGGWFTASCVPAQCEAGGHDHVPGEAQYACQRAVARHLAAVRTRYPKAFLWLMRPMMDLGVWTYQNGDAVFTILENGDVENLTGVVGQPRNITFGDKIRVWARIRRDQHFCPHYLDQAQLFPGVDGCGGVRFPWDGAKLDYLMLSAISTTPNQCYFTGPIASIPSSDRAVIRRWLDWSRQHAAYLMVRKDLPDGPRTGAVDGSAHMVGDRGVVFLFNPNNKALAGEFGLTEDSIGLTGQGDFEVIQEYPRADRRAKVAAGQAVHWDVPAESAVMLWVRPADPAWNRDDCAGSASFGFP